MLHAVPESNAVSSWNIKPDKAQRGTSGSRARTKQTPYVLPSRTSRRALWLTFSTTPAFLPAQCLHSYICLDSQERRRVVAHRGPCCFAKTRGAVYETTLASFCSLHSTSEVGEPPALLLTPLPDTRVGRQPPITSQPS